MEKEVTIGELERIRTIAALEYSRGLIHGSDLVNPYEDDMVALTNTLMSATDIKWEVNQK